MINEPGEDRKNTIKTTTKNIQCARKHTKI